MDISPPPRLLDYLPIALFSFALFGYSGISGRPLTMHEARLPETSREMKESGDWLLPHSGGRPWLERPPLPHWVVIGSMKLFHRDDREWVVRLPSAVMGLLVILLTVWMSGRWFGRTIGVASGLLLATSFEFYQYASLAEDDIYLAALVTICIAVLVKADFFSPKPLRDRGVHFLGNRPWELWVFFVLLGLTTLTKGPLLGMIIIGSTVGAYALWTSWTERSWRRLLPYMWLWGWLVMLVVGAAWPMWAHHRYPDVLANWKYDYLGRMNGAYSGINQPWWYYAGALAVSMAPWTPVFLIGLWTTARAAFSRVTNTQPDRQNALRFTWAWAVAPLIVLSIPHGKHHHYLVPFLAPWAILAAFGLIRIANALGMQARRRFLVTSILIGVISIAYCAGQTFLAAPTDQTVDDTAFLKSVRSKVPSNAMLFINGKLGKTGNLDFFRIQFYSRPDAVLLHNLSYLRSDRITSSEIYVITRAQDEAKLRLLGSPLIVDQSIRSHDITGPEGRFTLFKLTFDPNLTRYPPPADITTMQAMERTAGPWCGPPM